MADDRNDNKCAHAACSCPVASGETYCSPVCSAEGGNDLTTIGCDCAHPGCGGNV